MATPEHILQKVKLLINLSASSNANEADNARAMVDKLIAKHNISTEELESLKEKKPLYGDDDKLFVTLGLVSWRQSLALTIAKQFYCQIVQEELVPVEGLHQFIYYVYGDKEDSNNVKYVFNIFANRIEEFVESKCIGRGPVFTSSYIEGLVEAINNAIMWDGIDIPNVKVPTREKPIVADDLTLSNGTANLTAPQKEVKEKPVQETAKVSGPLIKDVNAYYKGVMDGASFSLQEILEIEAESQPIKELE